jgi:hypothetical protein
MGGFLSLSESDSRLWRTNTTNPAAVHEELEGASLHEAAEVI